MPRALDYLLLGPLRQRRFGLRMLRVSQVLHKRTSGAFDEFYVRWARVKSPPRPLGDPSFVSSTEIAAILRDLVADGCSILPRRLSESDFGEITDFAFSNSAYAFDPTKEFQLTVDAIPRDTAHHFCQMKRLARVPAIQRLMLEPAFSSIAQDYLKAIPLPAPDRPVVIGDDCWIGINVVATRGVVVGRGEVQPSSVVAGAPARPIGKRLDFAPPAAIEAARPEHGPYFYSGFDHRAGREAGLPCDPTCVLALCSESMDVLHLEIETRRGARVRGMGAPKFATPGRATVVLAVAADGAPYITFHIEGECRLHRAALARAVA